jgi:two-component system phosphate regulon sensor histidine kinase PhoR
MVSVGADLYAAQGSNKDVHDLRFCRFIIDSLPTAVVTVDANLKITGFNPWAEKLTGYTAQEAMGRYCGDVIQGDMCLVNCPLRTILKGHEPIPLVESTIRSKWGEIIPVRTNTAGLFDDDGHLIGGVESFEDISRLKAFEREKNNLISMFAHDMKSSLTTIGGFTLRLLKKATDIDQQKQNQYLEIVKKESSKLEILVNDFLEFSRLQTGKLRLDFGYTALDRELVELCEAYQAKASQSGISLELQNEELLPIIEADANRLRRVFTNLLDNALKFSKQGGKITITTQETDEDITVKIKDEGTGIDSRDLPYIFDSFFRGRGARKNEGSGLGLAVVKAIVEGHGGHISVESALGKGSVFTVVLPKARSSEEGICQNGGE